MTERRPDLAVHDLEPEDLDAAVAAHRAPVVVCSVPSAAVQARARGWVALLPEGANVALVGVGDSWRVVRAPRGEDVVAAIEGLLAPAFAPPPAPAIDAASAREGGGRRPVPSAGHPFNPPTADAIDAPKACETLSALTARCRLLPSRPANRLLPPRVEVARRTSGSAIGRRSAACWRARRMRRSARSWASAGSGLARRSSGLAAGCRHDIRQNPKVIDRPERIVMSTRSEFGCLSSY